MAEVVYSGLLHDENARTIYAFHDEDTRNVVIADAQTGERLVVMTPLAAEGLAGSLKHRAKIARTELP